ncbi:MAG TPA: rhodanese-like domain-containing protein [Hyphomicrobiales bacterium]|nr:rhodanese-like domain-containing protein [Hyphomicrobiales bacterium]
MNSGEPGYAGDLDPAEAMERLKREPGTQLVDVRTQAEWDAVGVPDLGGIGKAPIFIEWGVVPDFLGDLGKALAERGLGTDVPLLFLCRSGNRSGQAARAATAAGFPQSFNVIEGYEGAPGASEKLGRPVGWKARKLPWTRR